MTEQILLSQRSFSDGKVLPFLVKEEYISTPGGAYSLYLFSQEINTNDTQDRKFRYRKLRFDGIDARFQSRSDASQYARQRLALD